MPPPKGRPLNQEKQDERKQLLLEAAYELLEEKSYRSITIRDIAHKAGMKSGMISYYFGSKEGLFLAMIEDKAKLNFQRIQTAVQSDQPIKEFIKAAISHFSENPSLSRFITDEILANPGPLRDQFIDAMPGKMAAFLPRFIAQQQEKGLIRADLNPKWVAFSLTTMIVMPFVGEPVRERAWKIDRQTIASEQWADHIYQLFMAGCGDPIPTPGNSK